MAVSKISHGESSSTRNPFGKSPRFDNIAKFFQHSGKLVRRDGNWVNIKSLKGKIVGLFFTSLPPTDNQTMCHCIQDVASAYNELSKSKKGQFEIVWIGKVDDYCQFKKYLKMMPWLAVPYEYSVARNFLCNCARIDGLEGYEIFLFNREGKLLTQGADLLFSVYGADSYPFTDARFKELQEEDYAIRRKKSLKNLLGNAARDFVLRNDGRKVSISELENKVVGIYFCNIDYAIGSYFVAKLVEIYSQLEKEGRQFEVVMVHIGGCCHGNYYNLPWLSLPRTDSNCKRLGRIFDPSDFHNCLVIVGMGGSFVNIFGYSTVSCYGIKAYPFSRLAVAELEKKKLEVSVKFLLTCGNENYVIRKEEKMSITYLCGKTILVLFAPFDRRKNELVPDLIKWYAKIKKKHADFEVILVASGFDQSSFDEYYGKMPWLAFPHNDTRTCTVFSELCINYPTLAVFGPDAQLLSMGSERHFYAKGTKAYPFSGKNALKDVYWVVSKRFMWPPGYNDMFAH